MSGLLLALAPAAGAGQERACVFEIEHIGRQGTRSEAGGVVNYFAGGGIRLHCQGTSIRMSSDSLASYGSRVVQFIGEVRYEDSTVVMTADRGTYFKDGERWEARGEVVTRNLRDGSTLTGPSLDYYRQVPGVRDTVELYAVTGRGKAGGLVRPVIRSTGVDSAGQRSEPYVIEADRIRLRGNDRIWAGGRVTVDRSDVAARGDSLHLDSGAGNRGVLIGDPEMNGRGRDTFDLRGTRIDLTLERRAISYVLARGNARAVSRDVDLVADTIGLDLDQEVLAQTLAWGTSRQPLAITTDYQIRGDSLAFDTPARRLREIRAFGRGWVGGRPDSGTGERDWLSGDTVVARFAPGDSAGVPQTRLAQVEAAGSARSFYRVPDRRRPALLPSISYARGDRILIEMKTKGPRDVDRVQVRGQVDGLHLEPQPVQADTAAAPAGSR